MINIICNSVTCSIENTVPANILFSKVYESIYLALRYTDKNKEYLKVKNRDSSWANNINTYVYLYKKKERQFPKGLLNIVTNILDVNNIEYNVKIVAEYNLIKKSDDIIIPDWAYTHQIDILKYCLEYKNGVIESPTGSGKTNIMGWLINQFTNPRALVVVPRVNLCNQLYESLKELLPDLKVDRLSGQYKTYDKDTNILIGVAPSVSQLVESNKDIFSDINLLLVDECGKAINKTFEIILSSCTNTEYKLGFSATPIKSLLNTAYFGDNNIKIKEQILIENNIIIEPAFISYKIDEPKITYLKVKQGDELLYADDNGTVTFNNKPPYYAVYTNAVATNKQRNQTIVDISKYLLNLPTRKGPIVVFIEWQDVHGNNLVELYKENNINITFLNGLTSNKDRDKIINSLKNETIEIVLATNVIAEGTNIINLEFAIIADGKKSASNLIQKIGRIVRQDRANNKTRCIAIDISDEEPFYLASATKHRKYAFISRYGDSNTYECKDITRLNSIIESIK